MSALWMLIQLYTTVSFGSPLRSRTYHTSRNETLLNCEPPNNINYDYADYEQYDFESGPFVYRRKKQTILLKRGRHTAIVESRCKPVCQETYV
jgi:hypothetical protein